MLLYIVIVGFRSIFAYLSEKIWYPWEIYNGIKIRILFKKKSYIA